MRRCVPLVLLFVAGSAQSAWAQLTPEQMADMLLTTARRAYNERQLPLATERFREFLKTYGNHKDANAARYGLGLTLLETFPPDFQAAVDVLKPAADTKDFADQPLAKYHLALAYRGLGLKATEKNAAAQQFNQALPQFAEAAALLAARKGPEDAEWYARARCDQAEMLLRLDKSQEAAPLMEPLLADAAQAKGKYRPAALYYLGYSKYQQKDFTAAARALAQLAPFADPAFGVHARYLLARTHQLAEERAEAATHYAELIAAYDAQRKAAEQALKNPDALKNDPYERQRLDALVKNPPPDYVARSWFYAGVLLYEDGRFAEAADRLAKFSAQYPNSPLIAEAQLRLGFCQVQLKQFGEALKSLDPHKDHAQLGDQARGWLARAQASAADPNNAQAVQQALGAAAENYRVAAEKAGQLAQADPSAKLRRADWLLARADAQQGVKQFKEAAATYQQVINENVEPLRTEQAGQRLATAHHLAGQFKEADDACVKFQQTYPNSPLLAAVLFRHAENGFAVAEAAAANPNLPNRAQELPKLYGEALKRYQKSIEKFPEYAHVNLARLGLALAHYRLGQFEEAGKTLSTIPEPDRTGDLAAAPYLLADCLLRTAPIDAEDALSAARLLEQVTQALKLLEVFLAAQPQSPQVPDALLKLGNAHQQVALVMGEPQDRNKSLTAARQAYEKLIQQFGNHALQPTAVFERAKVLAYANDVNGAINELNRFQGDPLKSSSVAPLALLRLSSLLRSQNKPADAANVLAACRQTHEAAMLNDPARAAWAPLVQYHQGLALREAGKLPEAQGVFDNLVKQFAGKPEAPEAAWRAGQCRKEQAEAKVQAARIALAKPGAKPEELTAANTAYQDGLKLVRETAQYFDGQFAPIAKQANASPAHLRLYYEAAWCQRILAEEEIKLARQKLRDEAQKKLQESVAKELPSGQPVPIVNPPEIAITAVPMQPAESKAREHYQALVKLAPEDQLALVARFELAEMHVQREETDAAITLLTQALQLEPANDLAEQLQLRLGSCYLAKKDPTAAAGQFALAAASEVPAIAADARYRLAEALMLKQDYSAAIEQLKPFRDQEPLKNIPQVSDRALLRMGHAYAHAGQWDASRQAMEALLQRYPQSTWREDARYGVGWAWQNQGQFDNAVNTYVQVTRNTTAEVAAKSQLQIGLSRLAQKRYPEAANALLVVPFTYDYPELSALALCEAAKAFVELKQPEQASNLLKKVIKDHGQGRWAEAAKQQLAEIK